MKDVLTPSNTDSLQKDHLGFPSHFVDPALKNSKEWCMGYTKAFHAEPASGPTDSSLFRNNANYSRYRKYARGEQSEDQYKELMGLKKNDGAYNSSFRNLDFSILKIGPKMRNTLMGQVLGNKYNINAKIIDPTSINQKRKERNEMLEFVMNQDAITNFEKLSKMGLEKPQAPGSELPRSLQEIDPWLDMHPKDMTAMEVKDYITLTLAVNDWPQLENEAVADLTEIGVTAIRPYIDSNGVIKLRKGIAERMKINKCVHADFRDAIRIGEYHEMTIADLKQRTNGSLGEDAYKQIANTVAGKGGNGNPYAGSVDKYWSDNTYTYAYDREKITVFDACWFSVDKETYVERKSLYGNRRMDKKDWNYTPFKGDLTVNEGKGISDEEYSKQNNGEKSIIRREIKNVYQCSWVVDTEACFDCGLMTNMVRASRSFTDTKLPWVIRTTDFMSPISWIEAVLDQAQLNWLQFQSHVASSKPDGIAIEKRSLAKMSTGGQAGEKWDPKEALRMYAEIGSYVFDGYDQNGQPLPWLPIKELKNGLSESAFQHLQLIIQMIDMMRQILGINPMVEGAMPPERMGKGVAELSFGATSNALSYLTNSYRSLYAGVCKMIADMIPNAMEYGQMDTMAEALGEESMQFFNLNKDIGLKEMGIILEEGPDDAMRARISQLCQTAVDKGEMDPEDAISIELEDNVFRAILMLRKKRRENRQLRMQEADANAQSQASAQAALQKSQADADAKKVQAETEKALAVDAQKAAMLEKAEQKKFLQEVILRKLDHSLTLTEMEQKLIDDVIRIHAQGSEEKEKAVLVAEAKEKSEPESKPSKSK